MLAIGFSTANADDCLRLQRVDIEFNEVLTDSVGQALISSFIGSCIDAELGRQMLGRLSSHLIDHGFVTTRPYLLEQDVSDGQIDIRILVGRIEAIVDAANGLSSARIVSAFLGHDEVLNLRDLETSLEVIERVESASASFEIRPGKQQGGSLLAIEFEDGSRFRSEFGVNAQTELEAQLSFRAVLDNPLEINDIVEFRYNSGDIFQSYQSNRSRELVYSFPLGSLLLSFSHSDISFTRRVQGINDSFLSSGETVVSEFEISKLIKRSQSSRMRLLVALELKDSKTFFEDQLIDISSYKTSQLRLELQHDWLARWGQLNSSFRLLQGLDSYGARDDDYFTLVDGSESEARLQFEKFTLDNQLIYQLPSPNWSLRLALGLQYSDDILFDNDKLYLGSPNTVRGYASALGGANAWYLRSDISKRLPAESAGVKYFAKTISVSAGLDYGRVKCEIDNRDLCGDIYALGLAIDIGDDNFYGRLSWGHPLREISSNVGADDIFLLDLRWNL